MNYIAHIHIGFHTQTSLLGNFLGDFVKGQISDTLPQSLIEGVIIHRKVDQFTDQHPHIIKLRQAFPDSLRRVSGIVIDVVFDYYLLKHWHRFSPQGAHQVLSEFYQQLAEFDAIEHAHFKHLRHSLIRSQWLIDYQSRLTCLRAFKAIEQRLRHKIIFAQQAYDFVEKQNALFEDTFISFYPELLQYALHCKQNTR